VPYQVCCQAKGRKLIEEILERKEAEEEAEIVADCLKVWDSMEGKLPSFEGFLCMYVGERLSRREAARRWN